MWSFYFWDKNVSKIIKLYVFKLYSLPSTLLMLEGTSTLWNCKFGFIYWNNQSDIASNLWKFVSNVIGAATYEKKYEGTTVKSFKNTYESPNHNVGEVTISYSLRAFCCVCEYLNFIGISKKMRCKKRCQLIWSCLWKFQSTKWRR